MRKNAAGERVFSYHAIIRFARSDLHLLSHTRRCARAIRYEHSFASKCGCLRDMRAGLCQINLSTLRSPRELRRTRLGTNILRYTPSRRRLVRLTVAWIILLTALLRNASSCKRNASVCFPVARYDLAKDFVNFVCCKLQS